MKVFLLGFMGSGKTYWGRRLAAGMNVPLIDLDEEIVKDAGMSIPDIFARKGEAYFRELERDKLHEILQNEHFIVSCGGGVPCFFDNMVVMNNEGLTIWLDAPVEVMVDRLKRWRHERPLIRDLDDDALREYVETKLNERRFFYQQAQLTINPVTSDLSLFTNKIYACIDPT
ncbi:MAG TPA: shikimate kinase [Chitinophagaceae bacterium]|nr:shikimate kinase [Chitinophagaceae bacterium]